MNRNWKQCGKYTEKSGLQQNIKPFARIENQKYNIYVFVIYAPVLHSAIYTMCCVINREASRYFDV